MFLAVGLYVAEAVQASTFLQCINNDTNMRVQSYGLGFEPQVLEPTKNGYTLLAESKSTVARGASRWRVEMLSETINSTLTPDRESLSVKTNVQDIEDVYHPNRRAVLFRSVVRVKDAQVATCAFHVQYLSHMIVRLTLYDNDVEIASECGKGSATIRHAVLYQEDAKQGDKDKKQDDTKTDKKIGTLSGQKHKYVLFAKIEQVLKVSRPGTATMKVSSAKSKKPVKDDSDKYKARYISQDPASLIVVKDTEKDDLFRVIKEGWETHQPGRAVLAKELRDQYTKIVEQGQIKPFALGQNKVWTIVKKGPPKVQIVPNETSDGYIGQIVGSQIAPSVYAGYDGTAAIDAARDWIAKVKQDRVGDKDFRSATKKQQIESLETKLKEMEKFTRIDHARREQYRSRLVQESEELALKLKAFAQQATEAQAIDDFSDKKKKKK